MVTISLLLIKFKNTIALPSKIGCRGPEMKIFYDQDWRRWREIMDVLP